MSGDRRPVRIANCSGFYGDRLAAAREMVDGGPIDVLTGDWLAELTMTILARTKMKGGPGFAGTFVKQLKDVLADSKDRGIRIVSNAGGLDPVGCAEAVRAFAGPEVRIAVVTGDDVTAQVAGWLADGSETFTNLDTGEAFDATTWPALTANAYLGSRGIAAALAAGADVVITGRVTDAALVVGPAAWWHSWDLSDESNVDAIAGAVVAGHVIECGTQATGGNYAFFTDVPGLTHPGFPIAEVAHDGSSVITKHWDTGGLVSVGTVTSQLVYEIGPAEYPTPDAIALFDTTTATQVGCNRVLLSGTRGLPPPERYKVAMTRLGGFRNTMDLILTGLDPQAKADLALRSAAGVSLAQATAPGITPEALAALSDWDVERLEVALLGAEGVADPSDLSDAQAVLRVTVKDADPAKVGKPITSALIEVGLSSYPGFFASAPPGPGSPFAVLWPTTIDPGLITEEVSIDGEHVEVPAAMSSSTALPILDESVSGRRQWTRTEPPSAGEVARVPLGTLIGARSGDKGGAANIGCWIPDPAEPESVALAFGEGSAWSPTPDEFHDTAAVWDTDAPLSPDPEAVRRADAAYAWLVSLLTPDQIQQLLPEARGKTISVHLLPNLRAVNILIPGMLGRGVADSTLPDPQAKGLGEYLRARLVDIPLALLPPADAANPRGSDGSIG